MKQSPNKNRVLSLPSTDNTTGLTEVEARRRLKQYGYNDPVKVQKTSRIIQFLLLFAEPLIAILLVASAVSAIVGDAVNAVIILVMVLLGVILNFIQTSRSQNASEALKKAVSLTATVLRNGNWIEITRREVVPGDLIRLSAGDLVPADANLIESNTLHVAESALTGESLPVEKDVGAADSHQSTVFLGTSVISGTATALVSATGSLTVFGDIAKRLTDKVPQTDFERGTRKFGYLIMRVVFFLVIFVLIINVLMHRDILESLFFSIALAVGLTPEFCR